jgi:hypothetical protein
MNLCSVGGGGGWGEGVISRVTVGHFVLIHIIFLMERAGRAGFHKKFLQRRGSTTLYPDRICVISPIQLFQIPAVHTVQEVTKRCRLSWLTNGAHVYEPKCWVRGGVVGSQVMSTAVHMEPKINFGDLTPY